MSKSEAQVLDFEKICRLCLLEKRSMSSIFSKKKSDKKVPLPVRIMSCASLELYEGDGLPSSICSKCLLSVNQSYAFREQCEQADTTLRQYAQRVNEASEETSLKNAEDAESLAKKLQGSGGGGGGGGGDAGWEEYPGNKLESGIRLGISDKLCDSVEDKLEEMELEPRTGDDVVIKQEDFDGETAEDVEVEVEYLEEEYLKSLGDEEDQITATEGEISLKSENDDESSAILLEDIKVEEQWDVEGENLTFMLIESDVDDGEGQLVGDVDEDEEDEDLDEEEEEEEEDEEEEDEEEDDDDDIEEEEEEEEEEDVEDDEEEDAFGGHLGNGGEATVICKLCEKRVRCDYLQTHFKLIHAFKYCEYCKTEIKEKYYKSHMKAHEEDKVNCNLCNRLVRKKDFLRHYKKHEDMDAGDKRERVSRKICDICGYRVEGKITLNKHMREKHDEGQNYCELCEKYVWVKCFEKHIEDVHEDLENFCVICQKSFKYYKNHMRSNHADIVRFCVYCQVDVEAYDFNGHMASVHSKQSRFCETCNKEFFEFVCYKNHVKNIHLKVKSYKCSECEFTTAYRTSMDKHILGTHTRNQKYVCEICAKEFIVKDNLRKHIRMIHNGQQRSVCTYCGKICHANRELINHVRLHTGDLPYQCEFCMRKFPKKWTLDNHRRIHTGEKPYKCTHCDSAFGTSAQMKIHEFREHGVEKYRHVDRAGKRRKLVHHDSILGV